MSNPNLAVCLDSRGEPTVAGSDQQLMEMSPSNSVQHPSSGGDPEISTNHAEPKLPEGVSNALHVPKEEPMFDLSLPVHELLASLLKMKSMKNQIPSPELAQQLATTLHPILLKASHEELARCIALFDTEQLRQACFREVYGDPAMQLFGAAPPPPMISPTMISPTGGNSQFPANFLSHPGAPGTSQSNADGLATGNPRDLIVPPYSNDRICQCVLCFKRFSNNSRLNAHMKVHSADRPHACPQCGKRFARKHHMRDHVLMVHQRYKPFECPHCLKCFGKRSTLVRHVATHSGMKPFQCSVPACNRRFRDYSNLQRHVHTHSPNDMQHFFAGQGGTVPGAPFMGAPPPPGTMPSGSFPPGLPGMGPLMSVPAKVISTLNDTPPPAPSGPIVGTVDGSGLDPHTHSNPPSRLTQFSDMATDHIREKIEPGLQDASGDTELSKLDEQSSTLKKMTNTLLSAALQSDRSNSIESVQTFAGQVASFSGSNNGTVPLMSPTGSSGMISYPVGYPGGIHIGISLPTGFPGAVSPQGAFPPGTFGPGPAGQFGFPGAYVPPPPPVMNNIGQQMDGIAETNHETAMQAEVQVA